MKKIIAMLLVLCMVAAVSGVTAFAAEADGSVTKKSNTLVDRDSNRYEVSLSVPGEELKIHDEIIIMVDGSYSTDGEWINAVRPALLEIGEGILDGSGRALITLMTFGIGDNVVVEGARSMNELNSKLPSLPGGLLYGRSSTNCEAGFTGIERYINSKDYELDNVYVVYISDGRVNTDETPFDFSIWKETHTIIAPEDIAAEAVACEILGVSGDPSLEFSNAFKEVFGETDTADWEAFLANASKEDLLAYGDKLYAEVFAASGLDINQKYSVSVVERAFLDWQNDGHGIVEDFYYYTTYKNKDYSFNTNVSASRAAAACEALASNSKVRDIYLIDSDSTTPWMSGLDSNDKVTFAAAGSMSNLLNTLDTAIEELSVTPYNDVVITDYMSKWVNFEQGTIKITDNTTGKVIYDEAKGGWLIDAGRPTAQQIPVIVENVWQGEYAQGGENVVGNVSGEIYKLTWYVKDGAMLRTDNYTMSYYVTVDTEEAGFEYDVSYPANGLTTESYKDENGNGVTKEIKVPQVDAPTTTIIDEEIPKYDGGDDEYVEIFDEEVPKGPNPGTGGAAPWMLLVIPAMAVMAAAVVFAARKIEAK
ncbi:MAG: hypothetical protein IJO96_03355 [Oscillospiraceae bacterium]|nr:hypothetical protein [Oscillospiraceae bacterium]